MSDQCHRQFIRAIVGSQYKIEAKGDLAMFTALGVVLRVVLSPGLPRAIQTRFKQIGLLMLQKERLHTKTTELQRLVDGHPPSPNQSSHLGQIVDFLRRVHKLVFPPPSLQLEPLTFWFAMCLALDHDALCRAQWIHCRDSIAKDFKEAVAAHPWNLLTLLPPVTTMQHVELPIESILDYQCLITTDEVGDVGGFRIRPHEGGCEPIYVVSAEGFEILFADDKKHVQCPICLETMLTRDDFIPVGPKRDLTKEIHMRGFARREKKKEDLPPPQMEDKKQHRNSRRKILVLMEGCVGAGKSTLAIRLQEVLELKYGATCQREGVDQYTLLGQSFADAPKRVAAACETFVQQVEGGDEAGPAVLILDVCGPHNNQAIFGQWFTGWKRIKWRVNWVRERTDAYLAWCLKHVLDRKHPGPRDHFSLNPEDVSLDQCIAIHNKKARGLCGDKNVKKMCAVDTSSLDEARASLDAAAQAYQSVLDTRPSMSIDNQIQAVIEKMGLS
jgi:hypothetical protein